MDDTPPSPTEFRQRLGYLLFGLAIGCVLLGLFWSIRSQMAQRANPPTPQAAPN